MLHFGDRTGFTLQSLTIPCGGLERPLRLLHLSDIHLCLKDHAKLAFIRHVTDADYDFVFLTGDIAEEPEAETLVPSLLSRIPRYGAFAVLGNHDHRRLSIQESFKELFTGEFLGGAAMSDVPPMKRRMEEGDRWRVLVNEAALIEVDGKTVAIAGVDDPATRHGDLQRTMQHVKQADLLIGLVHVPTDLSSFSQRGFHLVLAGHTHGGQIRLPFIGALRTQCDLPRRRARGLFQVGRTWVHVSAGLGSGKLIRMRSFCPPTAYAITLVPRA
jgi:predicted MPP superfamily phosphohydrolase